MNKPMTKREWLSYIEKTWDTAQREAWGETPRKGAGMNCCDAYGNCTQGRDCPIRRQRYLSNKQIYIRIGIALLVFWHAVAFLVYWGLT